MSTDVFLSQSRSKSRPTTAKNALKMSITIGVWTMSGCRGPRNESDMAASGSGAWRGGGATLLRAGRGLQANAILRRMATRPPLPLVLPRVLGVLAFEAALLAWGLGGFTALAASPRARAALHGSVGAAGRAA